MVKLQRVKRSNDTYLYSINIPLYLIEELGWNKGNHLSVEVEKVEIGSCLIIKREEE